MNATAAPVIPAKTYIDAAAVMENLNKHRREAAKLQEEIDKLMVRLAAERHVIGALQDIHAIAKPV